MRKTRSRPHGYRHKITQHWTISPPSLYLSRRWVTTLLTRIEPELTARGCTAEFTNRYFGCITLSAFSTHSSGIQISPPDVMARDKYLRPTLLLYQDASTMRINSSIVAMPTSQQPVWNAMKSLTTQQHCFTTHYPEAPTDPATGLHGFRLRNRRYSDNRRIQGPTSE